MFGELNKKMVTVDWGVKTEGWQFCKCSDLNENEIIPIQGMFITPDNGYGKGCVLILKDRLLNIPTRYMELVEGILSNDEYVEAVKAGKCGIRITTFDSKKYKRKGYDVEFVDV